jgi:hypothetical protein
MLAIAACHAVGALLAAGLGQRRPREFASRKAESATSGCGVESRGRA